MSIKEEIREVLEDYFYFYTTSKDDKIFDEIIGHIFTIIKKELPMKFNKEGLRFHPERELYNQAIQEMENKLEGREN